MNNLRMLREGKGLSQKRLAEVLGYAQSTISQWENGTRIIDGNMLTTLADYFGVSIDHVLGRDQPPVGYSESAKPEHDDLRFAAKLGIDPEDATPELQERLGRIAREMIDMAKKQGK